MGVAEAGPGGDAAGRRALFVDRDGTLNPDLHYLKDADRLEVFLGVGEALRLARSQGWLVLCVTNQSGIERGFYTEEDVRRIHERLNAIIAPTGGRVDAFYYCPHAPEHGCRCRKPGTELFERAQREWSIDLSKSAMVGDRVLDAEAGQKLGLRTVRVRWPLHALETDAEFAAHGVAPDLVAESFPAAVRQLLASA
ncbi:MAG TPA: HAD family hydrolase [Thermoplasmata archaeon]|nr:HAD family hydrolase [Thermoplasmata archaeon]